jgi:hypothetical protein
MHLIMLLCKLKNGMRKLKDKKYIIQIKFVTKFNKLLKIDLIN